jgi:hypothetical protein
MLNTLGRPGALLFLILAPLMAEEPGVEKVQAEEVPPTLSAATILAKENARNDAALEIKTASAGGLGIQPGVETWRPGNGESNSDSELSDLDAGNVEIQETHPQLATVGAWLATEPESIEQTDSALHQPSTNLIGIFAVKTDHRLQILIIPLTVLLIAYLVKVFQAPGRQLEAKVKPGPMSKRVKVQMGKDTEQVLRKMSARQPTPKVKVGP